MRLPQIRFVKDLHQWYTHNKRDLPWRRTKDPYKILISEVMLQQTQVDRVVPKYELFLASFPTVQELASSSPARVIALWQGLGYNRRALNLHKGAKVVAETMHGKYPSRPDRLVEIPGIGPYTAAAVSSFAFNNDSAVVDTNVIRVLARVFIGKKAMKNSPSRKEFDTLARDIMPPGTSRIHNNAIMEFGALVCKSKPLCGKCFASSYCAGFQEMKKGSLSEKELELLGTPKGGFGTVQSRFEGSDRQIRGRIIAVLKESARVSRKELFSMVKDHLRFTPEKGRFETILSRLEKDGMIESIGGRISLPH